MTNAPTHGPLEIDLFPKMTTVDTVPVSFTCMFDRPVDAAELSKVVNFVCDCVSERVKLADPNKSLLLRTVVRVISATACEVDVTVPSVEEIAMYRRCVADAELNERDPDKWHKLPDVN